MGELNPIEDLESQVGRTAILSVHSKGELELV